MRFTGCGDKAPRILFANLKSFALRYIVAKIVGSKSLVSISAYPRLT